MALPSSGPLSLNDIQGEHGGSNPISLSEYYGTVFGVPFSGALTIGDFYGTTNYPTSTHNITSGRKVSTAGSLSFYRYGYDNLDDSIGSINNSNVSFLSGSSILICKGTSTNEPDESRVIRLTLSGVHQRNVLSEVRFIQGNVTYRFEVGEVGDTELEARGIETETWNLQHTIGLNQSSWELFKADVADSANQPFGTYNNTLSPTVILVAGPGA